MQFKEVIGQKALCDVLSASLESGHVAHAYLFAGKTGYGTLALALACAQYLLCGGSKKKDSCGGCHSCISAAKGMHPDLHFVFPVVKKGSSTSVVSEDFVREWREMITESAYFGLAEWIEKMGGDENAQPMIYVAESASIMKNLVLKPYEADCRVFVIWLPERMNEECANKLLKVLEEPYPGTYFFMASEVPEKLLPTIRSRVQKINVPAIEEDCVAEFLESEYGISSEKAEKVSRIACGDVVKAVFLLKNDGDRNQFLQSFKSLMRLCWVREMVSVNRWVAEMVDGGRERQKHFLEYAANQVRENFMKNLNEGELVHLTEEEEEFSVRFSPFVNEYNIIQLYDAIDKAYTDVAHNGNSRIIFTDLCIKVMQNIRPHK